MGKYGIFGAAALSGALVGRTAGIGGPQEAEAARADIGDIVIEKDAPGRPHAGKVFAAIHAHLDDIPFYCAGTCAKLIAEGYTGYIIRTTNDERCGPGSFLQNIKSNEEEHVKMAKALGCTDVFDFYYRNHDMDAMSSIELRFRFIFLFRMLKVDTVITFNPWGHGEENPDHWVTGRVAEEACWMSSMGNDYPEHMLADVGLEPHGVRERYYFVGRPGQPYNRVVDITSHIEKKIQSIAECKAQGGGNNGSLLRARLAKEGKKLPALGNDDETADREYVRLFLIDEFKRLGEEHGVGYAECFYYIDQGNPAGKSNVDEYIEKNAVPM